MTRQIDVGGVPVGGGAPVSIQSMTNTRTDDVDATLSQIRALATAGCDIVRVAVPDQAAAHAVGKIKERSPLPVVVDIHFDYRLALEGGGRCLPPEEHPDSHRGKRRLAGEGYSGQIRQGVPRGDGGICLRPYSVAEPI